MGVQRRVSRWRGVQVAASPSCAVSHKAVALRKTTYSKRLWHSPRARGRCRARGHASWGPPQAVRSSADKGIAVAGMLVVEVLQERATG